MKFLEELASFFGRFHPILVHMPIGMLVLAFSMAAFAKFKKSLEFGSAIRFSLLLGALAAVLAAITGFLLSQDGGYEEDVLDFHQWLGISVAVLSLLCYWLYRDGDAVQGILGRLKSQRFTMLLAVVVLLGFTGHFGGTLTHGKGYIKDALPSDIKGFMGIKDEEEEIMVLENVQEAEVYGQVIQPILKARCQGCHGEKKQEGEFALHNQESLLKGGESGSLLEAGNKDKSELYRRLILPEGHEDRMPPKGRKPITADQIKLIAWWIDSGLTFEKKVKQLEQGEEIATILKKLESPVEPTESLMLYADLPEAPDLPENRLDAWQAKGIKVLPIATENNYVTINAINYPELSDKDIEDLMHIKENIVQLKLGHTKVTDQGMKLLASLPNLIRLHLEHTEVSDKGMEDLKSAPQLAYLNIVGTKVTEKGVEQLNSIKSLKDIYAFQSGARFNSDIPKGNGKSRVDTGNYELPFLESDTIKY